MNEQEFAQNLNADFGMPEGFRNEPAEQEIVYDWDGGVWDEIEQNA